MGQYYKAINTDKKECLASWEYGSGAKLMEHSWIGPDMASNDFINAAETLLSKGNPWHKTRLVWAGDYMDPNLYFELDLLQDESFLQKCRNDFGENFEEHYLEDMNLYNVASYEFRIIKKEETAKMQFAPQRYIVNHSKKLYVDKLACPETDPGWVVHPLPLLTCSGNGRGGGDYRSDADIDYVGAWANDVISVENSLEDYSGYEQLKVGFAE